MDTPFLLPQDEIALVLLSAMVAIVTCALCFALARRAGSNGDSRLRYWRAGGALAVGAGICSMHALGMQVFSARPLPWQMGWPAFLIVFALMASLVYLSLLVLLRRPPLAASSRPLWQLSIALYTGLGVALLYYCAMRVASHLAGSSGFPARLIPDTALVLTVGGTAICILGLTLCMSAFSARREAREAIRTAALQQSNIELQQLAFSDDLTKLPNRMLLMDRLTQAVARARREAHSIAVLFIDLDGFKRINDTLGHRAGDKALREVATRISGLLRSSDTVARLGGDEFVVLVDAVEDRTGLAMLAKRIENEVNAPLNINGEATRLSASIGIAIFPDDALDEKQLLDCADGAMYAAKAAGKNTHRFHDTAAGASTAGSMVELSDLRMALERTQFELFYEPKMDGRGGGMVGVEALVRWRHPRRGVVSARDFIGIAERHSLIVPIGRWVIDDACRQMRVWRDLGWRIPVSVNISAQQLRQPGLVEQIRASLVRHAVDAFQLTLEISEGNAMEHAEQTLNALLVIEQLGVLVAIDDFGTAYSSLRYLQRFPVNELKIDRSLVGEVEHSTEARGIVAAAINLGHSLNLRVVAEGVETMRQKEYLSILRCDVFQGHLFSGPLRAGELTSSLLEHRLVLRVLATEFEGGA